MATKKTNKTKRNAEFVFTKEQLTSANKYKHYRDVVNVVLKDDQTYTTEQVDNLIKKFMKEKVK